MTDDSPRNRALPENPDLEHLKNEAKERLALLRAAAPETQLAEAQFQIARDYGFSSWRGLKDKVEERDELSAYAGFYRHDPTLVKNMYFSVTQEGGHLWMERTNSAKFELTRQEDGRFASPGRTLFYGFEKDGAGRVQAMTIQEAGRPLRRVMRIDAASAEAIKAANTQARAQQRQPRAAILLPPEVLEQYVGHYASSFGLAMEISREDAVLYARATGQQRIPLSAEAEDTFFFAMLPAQIHFQVAAGKATALTLHQNGAEQIMPRVSAEEAEQAGAIIARRAQEQLQPRQVVSVPAAITARYAGRYRVDDRRVVTITAEDGKLFSQATGQSRFEIFPESPTKFFWTVVAAQIEFYLDHNQRVSHAVMHQAGQLIPVARLEDESVA